MSFQMSVHRRRKAAIAVAAASVVAGGGLSMAGGATAGSASMEAGWPQVGQVESAADSRARARGADLVVETVEVRSRTVDVGRAGDSPGDFVLFEERAFRPGTEKVVGRDSARCESGIRTFICSATLQVFGKGKIVVHGAFFGGDNAIAITGGTGRYAGVGGTMRVLDEGGGSTLLAFSFVR